MADDKQNFDFSAFNPLDCSICKNEMKEPVRLTCQHCFCKECILKSDSNSCPVCETPFCPTKITVDRVLNYVIESSNESSETCANCDEVYQPMSFCETCRQPLCEQCVKITHSAKCFASHQISPLEERGRLRGQLICKDHNGPFVLYCQEARQLMCIECFNNSSLERRNNFVNIDLAHKLCREKLDKSVIHLRAFQNELKEQRDVRKRLLDETNEKFKMAEEQVIDKFNQIIDILTRKKEELIEDIHSKKQTQTQQIQQQINALSNIEGPIRLNLLSASVFCSYASNIDLLHCYSDLNKNITSIVVSNKLQKISFKDNESTNYVESLISALRDLDLKTADSNKENQEENPLNTFPFVSLDLWKKMDQKLKQESVHSDASRSLSPLSFNYASQNGMNFNNSLFLLDPTTSSFDEQFQKIDSPIRQFSEESNKISKELLDVQRDITLRRCLLDKQSVGRLIERCETLANQLNNHLNFIHQIKPQLTDIWNEELELLYKQQSLVQNRLNELTRLQCFTQQALEIGQKLRPLANFLSTVISAVDNRRSGVSPIPPMEQICMEIMSILPDSQQRIEAIERVDEERRLTRESEKLVAENEVKALKKNLKETKKTRQRPISMIVEINRDRDDNISIGHTQKHQKRTKRPSQSDETSSVCSMSPRTLSSTVSLDTSLQGIEAPSPNSLSPLPIKQNSIDIPPAPPSPSSSTAKKPAKLPVALPSSNTPSVETMAARSLLLQSIKDKVKRID